MVIGKNQHFHFITDGNADIIVLCDHILAAQPSRGNIKNLF